VSVASAIAMGMDGPDSVIVIPIRLNLREDYVHCSCSDLFRMLL